MRHPNTIWRSRREIYNEQKRRKKKKTKTKTKSSGLNNNNVDDDDHTTHHWNGGGIGIGSKWGDNCGRSTTSGDGMVGNAAAAAGSITTSSGAIIILQWRKTLMKWWRRFKAEEVEDVLAAEDEVIGSRKSLSTSATNNGAAVTAAEFLEMMPRHQRNSVSSMNESMMKQPHHNMHYHHHHHQQQQQVFKSNSTNSMNAKSSKYHDPAMMTMIGDGADTRTSRGGSGGGVESIDPFAFTASTSTANNEKFVSAAGTNINSNNNNSLRKPSSPITITTTTATSTTTTTTLHPQDRGNPFLGWIPWTLHLSYDRMLRGIPGTGTRSKGMEGKFLGVNLDAIVLFQYHALCLRVTAVVCVLCIGIILPMNITACEEEKCNNGLTNYGRTTIANVVSTFTQSTTSQQQQTGKKNNGFWNIFWTNQSTLHLLRLYAIAICTWYIAYFTLKNIKREWRENLVLRRVYYLEADHYGNRMAELDRTVCKYPGGSAEDELLDDEASVEEDDIAAISSFPRQQRRRKKQTGEENREPWIPHPEHRDTVPSIELYSVLVGGLPSLPDEVVNSKDMQTALGFSKRDSIDWQLAVATTFFDHCVPNQPGFSSSVVAVTILPGAPELAKAWRKWYSAAAALRRLRFIRQVINEKVRKFTLHGIRDI